MDFVLKSSILYDKQFGFRQKHSAAMALLETVDQISQAMDNKKLQLEYLSTYPRPLILWYQKILLQKLENYGLRGSVLKWFTSYLENRQQFVYLNNSCSRNLKVTCGLPKGLFQDPFYLFYILMTWLTALNY